MGAGGSSRSAGGGGSSSDVEMADKGETPRPKSETSREKDERLEFDPSASSEIDTGEAVVIHPVFSAEIESDEDEDGHFRLDP